MASQQDSAERFQDVKYGQLGGPSSPPRSRMEVFRSKVWPFATGIITTLVIVLLVRLASPSSMTQTKTAQEIEGEEWNQCGRSSAVAMSRGCLMEPNFYGWFPARCVFPELSEKYPVFDDRTWYSDVNLTQEISSKDLWEGKHVKIYTKRLVKLSTLHRLLFPLFEC